MLHNIQEGWRSHTTVEVLSHAQSGQYVTRALDILCDVTSEILTGHVHSNDSPLNLTAQ